MIAIRTIGNNDFFINFVATLFCLVVQKYYLFLTLTKFCIKYFSEVVYLVSHACVLIVEYGIVYGCVHIQKSVKNT